MTISQELIAQLSERPEEKINPNNRVKYLHLRKDIILQECDAVTMDHLTFNGKQYLTASFSDGGNMETRFKFDAVTVAYKENENGDLDIIVVFKSPKDEYRKDVGRKLSETVLNLYLNADKKVNMWHHTNHYGYNAFVGTLPMKAIIGESVSDVIPPGILGKLTASDLRNSLVVDAMKTDVYGLIEQISDVRYPGSLAWGPSYKFD